MREFQLEFATEDGCQQYLAACRWPDGFVCPRCGNQRAYALLKLKRWQCTGCRQQVSLTAGTILLKDKSITSRVPRPQIERAFDLKRQLRNIDKIFARVFGGERKSKPAVLKKRPSKLL